MAKAKVLTKDEMKRVEKIIAADSNATRNMLAFKLSVLGGMRVGEVAALTVGQVRGLDGKAVAVINLTDISQITFNSEQIVGDLRHRWKEFCSAVIRQPRFDDLAVVGSRFGQFCRHPDTPLLSFPPCRQFPRPTPERGFGVDHQSRPRFSGTRFSTRQPRLIGT